ncbi:MAG: hypothetical protein JJ896_08455 [Rhodothermales bacterium]|nr:hypothetical protein [Rhodothermales bacterium]MBO6779674.1 hypothetical protein [Rhodothermales bacterium]
MGVRPVIVLAGLLLLATPDPASAQRQVAGEWAWRHVHEADSVRVRYILYSEADNYNNGVVLRLDNFGTADVTYRFVAIFRSGEDRAETLVEGSLEAGASITGDSDGLFFIPFEDGREVTQIGMRGFRVTRR